MDKQLVNLKLLENGDIRLKTNHVVTPHKDNSVIALNVEYVKFIANNRYVVYMDTEDYLSHMLWATPIRFDHSELKKGVLAIDTGYEHKSVPALIMHTQKGQKVHYRDKNKFNLRKSNLVVSGKVS